MGEKDSELKRRLLLCAMGDLDNVLFSSQGPRAGNCLQASALIIAELMRSWCKRRGQRNGEFGTNWGPRGVWGIGAWHPEALDGPVKRQAVTIHLL